MNYRGGKEAFWATAAAESEYLSGVVDHGLGGGVAEPPEDSGADHQPTMRGRVQKSDHFRYPLQRHGCLWIRRAPEQKLVRI